MGVSTATINVTYDPAVLRVVSCDKDSEDVFDLTQCNQNFSSNVVRFNVTSLSGVSGDIPMAKITFEAIGQDGDASPIGIEVMTITDALGTPLPITVVDGRVVISSQRMGDVNCDGKRNIVDSLFTLQYDVALRDGSDTCTQPQRNARILYKPVCDVSLDTQCGVLDALFTLQCDVGLSNPSCIDAANAASRQSTLLNRRAPMLANGGRLSVETIPAGTTGTVTIPIYLQDASDIHATAIEVYYDETVLRAQSCTETEDDRVDLSQCNPAKAPGVVRFNVLSVDGLSGDIKLVDVTFEIIEETLATDISLGLANYDTVDIEGDPLTLTVDGENVPPQGTSLSTVKLYLPIIQR